MNKTNLLLLIIILSAAFVCATGVASAISLRDEYVGNTVVDLKWSEYEIEDFLKYVLYRDGTPIHTEFNRETTFYRNTGLSKGVTYDYKIEVYNATVLVDLDTRSVTTGDVLGKIRLDTTWTAASSPYTLVGHVLTDEDATLTIQSGVTVNHRSVHGTIAPLDTVTFNGVEVSSHLGCNGYSIKNCRFIN